MLRFSVDSEAQRGLKVTLTAKKQIRIVFKEYSFLYQKAEWSGSKGEVRVLPGGVGKLFMEDATLE